MFNKYFEKAILIREVEETFLRLFSEGKLNGTVHTCIGQEFSAIAVCNFLCDSDFVVSNHRCHGHYLAFKNDPIGLIAELMGKKKGICGGIGSSQHLFNDNFLSNGVQGGIVPIAAGISLAKKINKSEGITVVFIGDGTLGQGAVYEAMNIISLWQLPVLIVCENNFYAQSTAQGDNLAGNILNRAEAFNIKTFAGNTWEYQKLFDCSETAINYVRNSKKPAFFLIDTYRLRAHSKGDDNRNKEEIDSYSKKDPIYLFSITDPKMYNTYFMNAKNIIDKILQDLAEDVETSIEEYVISFKEHEPLHWGVLGQSTNKKYSDLIYEFFVEKMEINKKIVLLGEDLKHPYGGAFKVSKDLSVRFADRVYSTPISESAIMGIANGLALGGYRSFPEIMFGDFVTLAFDQIVNHASKFYLMYNKKINCPVVLRTPMGGKRRYGPTHSQSLEKFLVGIDNIKLLALNILVNPKEIYNSIIENESNPVIVIENKIDYARKHSYPFIQNYIYEKSSELYPTIRVKPSRSQPNLTIVTYGGMVSNVLEIVDYLIEEFELLPEIFVISQLHPLNIEPLLESVNKTRSLVSVEEGKKSGGIGSEIVALLSEICKSKINILRIASLDYPIPSVGNLEDEVIPTRNRIIFSIKRRFYDSKF